MKVVVAHNRYAAASPSGENVIVDAEIAQLRAAGVTVVPFLRSSDEISSLPATQKALLPLSPVYNRASQQALADLLRTEKPDLLHLHNPYPLLSPWVVRTAHRHGVPVIQTVHNYRQVCSSGLYFRDGHVCHDCRGRALGLPAIQHACYRGSRAQSAVMATTLAIHRGTWRSVDRYIALTSAIGDHLRDYGIPADRISVKPNAVPDPGPVSVTPGHGFLFAARLSPEKGLGLLLDAWRGHAEGELGTLRIAGDGPLRPLAEEVAAARADVTYLGPLDRAATMAQIAAAACVVAPSAWHDVLPTIVLESLACGRPVLGTTMGGIPYLVGDAGWVVEPEPGAIAGGLKAAYAGAARLAPAARRRYEESFAPEVLVQRLIEIYEEVAK
ncbi:glycosyltransferase family 4 protein [Planosporangium thailandense]|uniref:Glycosyltransferase family 4 protein n=1 Tax=Planosporangium thailandense TaxID=765197 RepID=A0ABX0XUA3_9ACTN|nr:glycosyltransferase family 4 protein [Planosporangium thailandense]NJC68922.1 glycosyltransferase family 4 protein [Planosporangium thailandense]